MRGHCSFALKAGNAAWHTVNSMDRETHYSWREGKWYRLNKLSTTDFRVLIYGICSLLSFVYTVCFTNTLTEPPASGYEVEVVKHTLPLCYGSSHYIEKEEIHSPHFVILTAWCFEWWGNTFSAFFKQELNETHTISMERMWVMRTHLDSVYASGEDEV